LASLCQKTVATFSHNSTWRDANINLGIILAILGAVLAVFAAGCFLLLAVTLPGRYLGENHPDSRILQFHDGPIRYVEEGNSSTTPPLLLLHGFQGTLSQWDDTWAQLKSCSVRRIRVDVPGFGRSVWESRDFSLDKQADRIVAFLDQLGISRVTLAGTSMGGSLAATIASRHPERVNQLALFAPSGYTGSLTYDGLFGILVKPGAPNRIATWITDTPIYRVIFPNSIAMETLTLTASYGTRWVESLHHIRAPTFMAWSTNDRTADSTAAPKVHAAISGSTLLTLDYQTGHSIPNSRPALTASLLCALAEGTLPSQILTESVRSQLRAGEALSKGQEGEG
jgi:pimeloyl-ACP methyl ester carboxylesterase